MEDNSRNKINITYTLFELSQSIERMISNTYKSSYWVKAEIAKLNYYSKSGHCYPDLVEKKNGKVIAQIRSTIWAGPFNDISTRFEQVTREKLSDGMMVLIRVTVVYHPVYGLTLQVHDIDPSFTLGELAREKQQSIDRLIAEGIFFSNKQLTAPLLLRRLAVISVETSKGYHDFIKVIENNENHYKLFTMLFPAVLQGEGAIKSITEQLKRIKKAAFHFDAVLIIRGGGGDVGLSSFDNYKLASEVAKFPLPIITGIGHATNFTVTEQVAFENKITPTEVAYYLLHKFQRFDKRIDDASEILIESIQDIIAEQKMRLKSDAVDLKSMTDNLLFNNKLSIKDLTSQLQTQTSSLVEKEKSVIMSRMIKMSSSISKLLMTSTFKISTIEDKVKLLHPDNVLKRGYSITTLNGKLVCNSDDLSEDDIIETRLKNGKVKSKILKK